MTVTYCFLLPVNTTTVTTATTGTTNTNTSTTTNTTNASKLAKKKWLLPEIINDITLLRN